MFCSRRYIILINWNDISHAIWTSMEYQSLRGQAGAMMIASSMWYLLILSRVWHRRLIRRNAYMLHSVQDWRTALQPISSSGEMQIGLSAESPKCGRTVELPCCATSIHARQVCSRTGSPPRCCRPPPNGLWIEWLHTILYGPIVQQ